MRVQMIRWAGVQLDGFPVTQGLQPSRGWRLVLLGAVGVMKETRPKPEVGQGQVRDFGSPTPLRMQPMWCLV